MIQGELLRALCAVGAVESATDTEGFFMASRTDKGVHAAGLLVQLWMNNLHIGQQAAFVQAVNAELQRRGKPASQIKVFDVVMAPWLESAGGQQPLRVNSCKLCVQREYLYVVPSFALAPVATETKTVDAMRSHMRRFRISKAQLAAADQVLSAYVGGGSFALFTPPNKSAVYQQEEGGTDRSITRCTCTAFEPQTKDGVQFVAIVICGDRYMYHQIRNMMGLAMLCIHAALDPRHVIASVLHGGPLPGGEKTPPLAPAAPLLLNTLHYGDLRVVDFLQRNTAQVRAFREQQLLPQVYHSAQNPMAEFVTELLCTGGPVSRLQKAARSK